MVRNSAHGTAFRERITGPDSAHGIGDFSPRNRRLPWGESRSAQVIARFRGRNYPDEMTTFERNPAIPPPENPTSADGITLLDDLPARIKAAGTRCLELAAQAKLALAQRNQLIVDGVDSGIPQRQVARLAGLSQPHVIRVLATS